MFHISVAPIVTFYRCCTHRPIIPVWQSNRRRTPVVSATVLTQGLFASLDRSRPLLDSTCPPCLLPRIATFRCLSPSNVCHMSERHSFCGRKSRDDKRLSYLSEPCETFRSYLLRVTMRTPSGDESGRNLAVRRAACGQIKEICFVLYNQADPCQIRAHVRDYILVVVYFSVDVVCDRWMSF